MSNEEPEPKSPGEPGRGLGFSHLAMNEIAPQTSGAPAEAERPNRTKWLWIVLVVAVVAGGVWLFRSALNLPPPAQVQQQVQQSTPVNTAIQQGWVHHVTFVSGSKLRLDFSPNIPTADDQSRKLLRRVTQQVMEAFIAAQPGRDLDIVGFQGDRQMLQARYLHRSTLVIGSGETAHDITIKVEGDTGGGITSGMRGQGARE